MALTVTENWTEVLGPRKREIVILSSDSTDNDTVVSLLQNPQRVSISGVNGTATPTDLSATVSGRTVTVANPNASEDYRLVIEGF